MKVNVQSDRGALRLRWRFEGKRFSLSLGLPDSPVTRAVARQRTAIIEQDIHTGQFDKTLLKYKPRIFGHAPTDLSCPELFEQYTKARQRDLQAGSLARYQSCLSNLRRCLNKPAHALTSYDADNF